MIGVSIWGKTNFIENSHKQQERSSLTIPNMNSFNQQSMMHTGYFMSQSIEGIVGYLQDPGADCLIFFYH
jgi:hypothetical protein